MFGVNLLIIVSILVTRANSLQKRYVYINTRKVKMFCEWVVFQIVGPQGLFFTKTLKHRFSRFVENFKLTFLLLIYPRVHKKILTNFYWIYITHTHADSHFLKTTFLSSGIDFF